MDGQQHITKGLLEFRRTQVRCVGTMPGLVEERQFRLLLDTGSAQGEGEFIPGAIGQDGMVQVGWRGHLAKPKYGLRSRESGAYTNSG